MFDAHTIERHYGVEIIQTAGLSDSNDTINQGYIDIGM